MRIKGKIFSGALQGGSVIGVYFHRLTGILGFEPFKGTLNVQLEKNIDIELYSTKAIDQILLDGTRKVDAFLAPIIFSAKGQDYECWAIRQGYTYKANVIEVVAKENLKEKFSLKDEDEVEITFFEQKRKKRRGIPGFGILKRLYGIQPQLTK